MDPAFLDIRDRKVFIQPERKPWMVVENETRECTISYGGDRGDIIVSEICGNNDPDTVIPLTDVIKAAAADGVELYCVAQFNAPARELMDFKTGQGQVWPDLTFGTIGMEVAVDTETGMIDVLKIISCFDVGQAINPLSAKSNASSSSTLSSASIDTVTCCVVVDSGANVTPAADTAAKSSAAVAVPSCVSAVMLTATSTGADKLTSKM